MNHFFQKRRKYVILQIVLVFFSWWRFALGDFDYPTASGTFWCDPITGTALDDITPCTTGLLNTILDTLVKFGIPIVGAIIVWAGFRIVAARGNEEQLRSAKRMLLWAVVGAGIVIGATVIVGAAINFANSLPTS